jgi:hypothetical protein
LFSIPMRLQQLPYGQLATRVFSGWQPLLEASRNCLMQLDETWVMSDGALLVVRPLRRQDASALGASFDGLSPEDRRHRFHGAVNGLPPWYLDSLAGADQWRYVALAASVAGSEGGPLIAEARWVVDASNGRS